MAADKSAFEQILGDSEHFAILLDGAFKDWDGTYDVLLNDTNEYLFESKNKPKFQEFCRLLRSRPKGEHYCKNNDIRIAEGLQDGTVGENSYFCHAGLIDIAIPIEIDGKTIATIFCGQVRSADPVQSERFLKRVQQLEEDLGFTNGELMALAQQVPEVDPARLQETIGRVHSFVSYIAELGSEKVKAEKATLKDRQRLEAGQILQRANQEMNDLSISWDEFWERINVVLDKMTSLIGATCGIVLVPGHGRHAAFHIVTAVAELPADVFHGRMYRLDDNTLARLHSPDRLHFIDPIDRDQPPGPVRKSIIDHAPDMAATLDTLVMLPVHINSQRDGVLVFFLNRRQDVANNSLPIDEEINILEQLAGNIGIAFNNRRLYTQRERSRQQRNNWQDTVVHQLLAPINALVGHAENTSGRLSKWRERDPRMFLSWEQRQIDQLTNSLDSILQTSFYAARLARNLQRQVFGSYSRDEISFSRVDDVGGLLIHIVRDFQGSASDRKLGKLEVDTPSARALDERLYVVTTERLFRQAIGNVVDNAVKYSYPGGDILVRCAVDGKWGIIEIINEGIELRAEETEEIFEYHYRTHEARDTYAPGTGIGLPVAREIIELHGGTLVARPSHPTRVVDGRQYWQTTFVARLPLDKEPHK